MGNLKPYLDLITKFADTSFTSQALIQWLAPKAVQLGAQALPPDKVYYTVQEKVVTLRTPSPQIGLVWWPSSGDQKEIQEVHITPVVASGRYEDLVKHLALGAEVRRQQGHVLADVEHTYPYKSTQGNTLEITLQEITFAEDSSLVGLLGGLTLRKISVDRGPHGKAVPPMLLQHHLLAGRWKAMEGRSIAETIDFEMAFAEKSGRRGCLFRTYSRQGFLDEGIWALEAESQIRLAWKSGLIQSFEFVVKGDRLILRDKSGLFRYKRARVTGVLNR